ncbi:TlpA family protein disulfide reductase [Pseudoflavitalea rhizosphaerae]|uniref:TlpA family protein disulfide reductase n=1 Tax=Pseudoflavitalea rhizosphaerae TaxID=1884793 RepID=UPI0013DF858F|nr:TlpA disulfide reductase family protein [Pseudoflavitalea rhizosphaerae]
MKITITLALIFLGLTPCFSRQSWTQKINDSVYQKILVKGLNIGDMAPNLHFGSLVNGDLLDEKSLGELKGKLVILDFWATWCITCINNFPKMEKLQKQYGDKIQIILVNPFESETNVLKRKPNFKFPNLPSIMKDSLGYSDKILKSFPIRNLGHQVWIDKNGIVKLRGLSYNNTSEKIAAALNDEDIFNLNDNAMAPQFDPEIPYLKLVGDFSNLKITTGSIVTPFNNEYDPETGFAQHVVDSVEGTVRNTFINVRILDLLCVAYQEVLKKSKSKILFGPTKNSARGVVGYHCVVLPKDTLRYTHSFINIASFDDTIYTKPKICYEQILPMSSSLKKQNDYMKEDIGRFLENTYEGKVTIEKRLVPCFILSRTSAKNKLRSNTVNKGSEINVVVKNGREYVEYQNTSMLVFSDLISKAEGLYRLFQNSNKLGHAYFFLDETGFNRRETINITLPRASDIRSIQDLRSALKKYDLDIVLGNRWFDFLVITDNSGK